ncbi:MAG: redoxin domain-containing protein [Dehalococcoidia bacterium]
MKYLLACFIALFVISACASQVHVGDQAPNFTLTDINGKRISLQDFRGKQVVLYLWFLYCPECTEDLAEIQELNNNSDERVIKFLTINPENSSKDVADFFTKNGYSFPVLFDLDGSIYKQYNLRPRSAPYTIIIAPDGKINNITVGNLHYQGGLKRLIGDNVTSFSPSAQTQKTPIIIVPSLQSHGVDELAYVSSETNTNSIYVVNANGEYIANSSGKMDALYHVSWSPNGDKIIFEVVKDINIDQRNMTLISSSDIYSLDIKDHEERRLTSNYPYSNCSPTWIEDDKIVFYSTRGSSYGSFLQNIYIMNADGSNQINLTNCAENVPMVLEPILSPDHLSAAYITGKLFDEDIYVINLVNGNKFEIGHNPTFAPWTWWSPNSKQIAYISASLNGGPESFYLYDVEKQKPIKYYDSPQSYSIMEIAWSPDSNKVAIFEKPQSLYVLDCLSSKFTKLDGICDWVVEMKWIPNNQQIAIIGDRFTNRNLYVIDIGEQSKHKINPEGTAVESYRWSTDNTRIIYCLDDGYLYTTFLPNLNTIKLMQLNKNTIKGLALSPDGLLIAVALSDDTLTVISLNNNKVCLLTNDYYNIGAISWSQNSNILAFEYGTLWDSPFVCSNIQIINFENEEQFIKLDKPISGRSPIWARKEK